MVGGPSIAGGGTRRMSANDARRRRARGTSLREGDCPLVRSGEGDSRRLVWDLTLLSVAGGVA